MKIDPVDTFDGIARRKVPRRLVPVALVVVAVAGSLWLGFKGTSLGPSTAAMIQDCSRTLTGQHVVLKPVVVGRGSSVSVGVFTARGAFRYCEAGIGWSSGPEPPPTTPTGASVPFAIYDGQFPPPTDVLVIVRLAPPTVNASVVTEWARSTVLSRGGGFEVLRLSTPHWPRWRLTAKTPVTLGSVLGFDRAGHVTSDTAFYWCPDAYAVVAGYGC